MTQVHELMSAAPVTCHPYDSLNRAAQLMWEHDCGCVPVVDDLDHVIGIVTDRDICMGAYTQGRALAEIPVASVCTHEIQTCAPSDPLDKAEGQMITHQVRRLPVTDPDGHLVGVLSVSDLARHMHLLNPAKGNGASTRALSLVMEAVSRWRETLRRHDKSEGTDAASKA
jgi:CBS domain-containing protein